MSTEEQLPEGWELAKIGDIADVVGGSTPSRTEKHYFGGDIIWLTPTEIPKGTVSSITTSKEKLTKEGFNSSGVRWIPKGSVLLTSRASIGYVAVAGTELTTNQGFASFILPNDINPFYFAWWLKSQKDYLEDIAGGTTFKEISKTTLKDIFAPLPPLPEQNRIVAAIEQQFTRLDSAVASLQSAQARIKQYRASLLKSAVEGELTKQWQAEHTPEETGEQLLQRILIERHKRWEEEELAKMREKGVTPRDDAWKRKYKEPQQPDVEKLPKLPEGWCWATINSISNKVVDGVHKKPDYVNEGIPFVTIRNLTNGPGISFEKLKYITEKDHIEFCKRANPEKGDILITKDGTLGVVRLIRTNRQFSIFVSVGLIKPVIKTMSEYLEIALSSPQVQTQMTPKGSGLQHLHLEDLRINCVPIPPLAEQQQIIAEVEAGLSNIEQLETTTEHSLKRAEHERQSILREAFAGRLVPQDPEDEPASVLLEHIKEERKKRAEAEEVTKASRKGSRMDGGRKRRAGKATDGEGAIDLHQTLVEAGQPLPPDDLFRRAGLKADEQPESVELFYEALHSDVEDGLIKELRPDDAHVLLTVSESSADVAVQAAEEDESQPAEIEGTAKPASEPGKDVGQLRMQWDL